MSEARPRAPRLRVAYYGDDFTGSVDVLLQFARHGRTGRLFTTLPDAAALAAAAAEVDVVGVAGIARSLPTAQLDGEVGPALRALRALDPDVLQYKACSTADSSPSIGSIGRVLEIGRGIVGERPVPMLFAQPDFGRYTVFGHHFASEGAVVHRLDRQPTMSTHPSTPMTESDLVVHLGHQTDLALGAVSLTDYDALPERLRSSGAAALVLDALSDGDLLRIGKALLDLPAPLFAIGSGGLSAAVGAARPRPGAALATSTASSGPVLVVSGSRSPQTRRQADAAAVAGWLVQPLDLRENAEADPAVLTALARGRSVVLTSDDADVAVDPGAGAGRGAARPVLERIADAAASVVRVAAEEGLSRRIVVAGGDTSSRVTRLLGVDSLSIAANPWGNVVLLRAHAADPAVDGLELLLKGGQVGADSLLVDLRALAD